MEELNQVKTISSSSSFQRRIENVYTLFTKVIKPRSRVIIAYSGGKDSTALLILFYNWLRHYTPKDIEIILLHNDTLGEIPPMELWARKCMKQAEHLFEELGHTAKTVITSPQLTDTFYWRVIIRGYPAPSYNFRWCVKLLKRDPTRKTLQNSTSSTEGKTILLTGLRESESIDRIKAIRQRYGGCSSGAGKCLAYFLSAEPFDRVEKIAPLRNWEDIDVWSFLSLDSPFEITDLLDLYSCEGARYGCWHCTLVKVQWGLHSLNDDKYLYLDAARLIYRKVSDIPLLRKHKKTGYSKFGALNAAGRAIMFHLFEIVEKISGVRLYGLDEAKTLSGISLRELFYQSSIEQAEEIINSEDYKIDPKRYVHFSEIKAPNEKNVSIIKNALKRIEKTTRTEKSRQLIIKKGFDAVGEIIQYLYSEF